MSHTRMRRHFSAEQKAAVIRRHLRGKESISKLAEELGVQPGLIHNWVNQVLAQRRMSLRKRTKTAATKSSRTAANPDSGGKYGFSIIDFRV